VPEDGWRGGALHRCPLKLFDGCALYLRECAQTTRQDGDVFAALVRVGGARGAGCTAVVALCADRMGPAVIVCVVGHRI